MKKFTWGLGAVLLALILGACTPKDANTIVFATDATWPPMEFVDDQKNLVGFDIDMVKAIAEAAGFTAEFRVVDWNGIFAGLENGQYNAIVSSVTINEERQAKYDFSKPYVQAGQVLVVPVGADDATTLATLAGQSVGTQIGTAGSFEVQRYPDVMLKEYETVGLALQDLANGNLAAVVCDSPVAADFALQNPDFQGKIKIVGSLMTAEDFGMVVKKGDTELLAKLNAGLDTIMANGTLDSIKARWGLR